MKKIPIQHFLTMEGSRKERATKLVYHLQEFNNIINMDKDIYLYDMLEQAKRNNLIKDYVRIAIGSMQVIHFDDTNE